MHSNKLMVVVSVVTALTTVILSMLLNVWAFTKSMPGCFGTVVGILLPLWVLALTFTGKWASEQGKKFLCIGAYALAGFLLLVSLPHLATGFSKITEGRMYESWSLALVVDLTQVIMKLAVIHIAKMGGTNNEEVTPKKKRNRTKKESLTVAA